MTAQTTAPYEVVLRDGASRPDWLDARRSGIGGSDAAAVLGLGGYSSPLAVYASKVGVELPDHDTEAMALGRMLEEPVAQLWAQRHGVHVRRGPALMRSRRWPWLIASVDRFVTASARARRWDAVLEVKARNLFVAHEWETGVPPDVVAQTWVYLAVTGLPIAHVACLVGGSELRSYSIEADPDLLEDVAARLGDWWSRHVQARVLPPLTRDDDNAALLAALTPAEPGSAIELDDDSALLVRRLIAAKAEAKAAQQAEKALADQVRLALGTAETGLYRGKTAVTWKAGTRSSLDVNALRAAHPALASEFTRETPTRTLLTKAID